MRMNRKKTGAASLLLVLALLAGFLAPLNVTVAEAKTRTSTYTYNLLRGESTSKIFTYNTRSVKSSNPKVARAVYNKTGKNVVIQAKKAGKAVVTIREKYGSTTYVSRYNVFVENKNAKVKVNKYSSVYTSASGNEYSNFYAMFTVKNNSKRFYYSSVKVGFEFGLSDGKVETSYAYVFDLLPQQSAKCMRTIGSFYSFNPKTIKYVKVKSVTVTNGSYRAKYVNQTKHVTASVKKNGEYVNVAAKNNSKTKVWGRVDVAMIDKNGKCSNIRTVPFLINGKQTVKDSIRITTPQEQKSFKVIAKHFYSLQ